MGVCYSKRNKEILRMALEGKTFDEILSVVDGKYFGLRKHLNNKLPSTYKLILRNNKEHQQRSTVEERLSGIDLVEKCEQGYSLSKLSTDLGIAPQTLKRYVRSFLPDSYDKFIQNGVNHKKNKMKLTEEDVKRMMELSQSGMGIDSIGKTFNVDGTAVRYRLIQAYGESKYQELHPKRRFKENNGWNGKEIEYNGERYQSFGEVKVAHVLSELGIPFQAHPQIQLGDKVFYPDFFLPSLEVYVEYTGMLKMPFYRAKFASKLTNYSLQGIKCIVVVEETLPFLSDTLKELI